MEFQILVLMPQARITHQPRAASYNMNPPQIVPMTQDHSQYRHAMKPATIKAMPPVARSIRPSGPMFGLKNSFTAIV